jgi:sigma-E factor negative regulatory protein RseB
MSSRRPCRLPLAALLVLVGSVLAGTALAAGASAVGAPASEPNDAGGWLARMHEAALKGNYRGTMVVSAGGVVSSSGVAHYSRGDQTYERVESLDGAQQRVYRHNELVHTVWPQSKEAVVERRSLPRLPGLQAVEPRALEQYTLRLQGSERIAGREAQVLLLEPRDEYRFAQRLWADRASGLMLRADVLGARREVLESSAFSEVDIGVEPQPETVLSAMKNLEGYRVVHAKPVPTRLEAEGWQLDEGGVPGFTLKSCVKRPLVATANAEPVLQAVFSDGLTHVSIFIEPFDEKRHPNTMQAQIGATHTLMQRHGEHWLTVMGDVPPPTLHRFAKTLQRRR